MEQKQNKKNQRNKTPLVLALLLLLTLVVYTSHAYFSDTKETDAGIQLALGNLKIHAPEKSEWQARRERHEVIHGDNFINVQPGDNFINTITVENEGSLDSDLEISIEMDPEIKGLEENDVIKLFDFHLYEDRKKANGFKEIPSKFPTSPNYHAYNKNKIKLEPQEKKVLTLVIQIKEDFKPEMNGAFINDKFNKEETVLLNLKDMVFKFKATQVNEKGRQEIQLAQLNLDK